MTMELSPESPDIARIKQLITSYEDRQAKSLSYGLLVNIGTVLAVAIVFGAVIFAWNYFNDTRDAQARVREASQLIGNLQKQIDALQNSLAKWQGSEIGGDWTSIEPARNRGNAYRCPEG